MGSRLLSIRLDEQLLADLERQARETESTRSALVHRYVDEGLRMERHPGIFFQTGPTGRRAKLMGGPDVWEVINVLRDCEGDPEERIQGVIEFTGLDRRWVDTAVRYYAEFQEEIDERIRRNDEAGERGYAEWQRRQAVLQR
jgi:hypothetical protein